MLHTKPISPISLNKLKILWPIRVSEKNVIPETVHFYQNICCVVVSLYLLFQFRVLCWWPLPSKYCLSSSLAYLRFCCKILTVLPLWLFPFKHEYSATMELQYRFKSLGASTIKVTTTTTGTFPLYSHLQKSSLKSLHIGDNTNTIADHKS